MSRLILRRLAANWKLLLAIFAGVTMASSLVVGAPVYIASLNRLSLDTSVERAPDRALRVRSYAPFVPVRQDALDEVDSNVGKAIDAQLSEIDDGVVRHLRTDSYLLGTQAHPLPSPDEQSGELPRGHFQTLSGLEGKTRLVQGDHATSKVEQGTSGPVVEATLGIGLANFFQLTVGDRMFLAQSLKSPARLTAVVTGIIAPIDPSDPYWPPIANMFRVTTQSAGGNPYQLDRSLGTDTQLLFDEDEVEVELAMFITNDALLNGIGAAFSTTFSTIDYYLAVDKEALKEWEPDEITTRLEDYEIDLTSRVEGAASVTGLTELIELFVERRFFSSIPLLLLVAVMLLTVLYYLSMMVAFLVESRADDVVSLRSRGTGLLQLARLYAVEGIAVIAVPVAVAPFLVMGVVALAGRLSYFDEFSEGGRLPVVAGPTAFLVALGAGVLCLLMFVIPGLVGGRSTVVGQRFRSFRAPSLPIIQRYYLDLGLLLLGGLLFWEIRARGHVVSGGLFKEIEINEALLVAPVLLLAVVALLFMRLFPIFVRYIGGESPVMAHLAAAAALVVLAPAIVAREIRDEYTFDWALPLALLAVVALSHVFAARTSRFWSRWVAIAVGAGAVAAFAYSESLPTDDALFAAVVLLIATVPLHAGFYLFRLAAKAAPVWAAVSLLHMSRNPFQYTWMMLLLVLLTGLGILSTTVGATLGLSQEEQALFEVAADLRVTDVQATTGDSRGELRRLFLDVPGVSDAALAHRTVGQVGADTDRRVFSVLALESEPFSKASWFRDDFAERSLSTMMADLTSSAVPRTLEAPEGSAGLGVWMKPLVPYPSIFVMFAIEDVRGVVEILNAGPVSRDGWQLMSSGIPGDLVQPVSLLSIQLFEFVYGPSGTPGSVLMDNVFAAGPDGETTIIDGFEDGLAWSPMKVSPASRDVIGLTGEETLTGEGAIRFSFSKDTDLGMRGIHRLSGAGRIPVLVSESFADATGTGPGNTFVVDIASRAFPVLITDIVAFFPTLPPEELGFMVMEMDSYLRYLNMLSPGLRFTADEVFISTVPGEDELAREGILRLGVQPTQLHYKDQILQSTRIDPLITAGWKLMVLISVGVIVVVSAIAYAVYLLAFATRGRGEAGTLRSMGLTRPQLMGLLGIEHVAIAVIGLALGNWAGFQMSQMMVSTLAITETGDPVIPPFLLRTEWGFMAPVYIVLGVVILTAIFAVYRAIGRMRLHEIARVEI